MSTASPKQATLKLVQRLSDDASFEDIQYQLYVLQQIEEGLKDVEEGRTIPHAEVREQMSRWMGDADSAESRG